MSRRPQAADRTAQNAATLKTLVKIESNKTCADCKRNKHPRWASWNLGIFICIRCSGIHRGMGTHISRVKSVDLDSWTDEQTASMVKWGNTRANKYWEAKLAPGHVPAEAKIENFIRTKYDSKRWTMDGPIPDPATLGDEGEDDVPLSTVQEKVKAAAPPTRSTATSSVPPPVVRPAANIDLFGDDPAPAPAPVPQRATTATPTAQQPPPPPPKAEPPRQAKPADSLLGFDFFGAAAANPPSRPMSAASTSNGPSRPDLKQSILSLYSKPSTPAPSAVPSAGPASPASQAPSSNFASLDDAFSGLNFGGGPPVQTNKPNAFSNLASPPPQQRSVANPPASTPRSSLLSGGSFFDSKSVPKPSQPTTAISRPAFTSATSGFSDFASAASPGWGAPAPAQTSSTNGIGDLFDFSAPEPPKPAPQPTEKLSNHMDSPFNISAPAKPSAPPPQTSTTNASNTFTSMSMDPWGSGNAWASTPAAQAQPKTLIAPAPPKAQPTISTSDGWGDFSSSTTPATAQVTADEDFGGWESSTAATPSVTQTSTYTPAAYGGSTGAFDNPWE